MLPESVLFTVYGPVNSVIIQHRLETGEKCVCVRVRAAAEEIRTATHCSNISAAAYVYVVTGVEKARV